MAKILMKGNEAIAEATIRAGADIFFGYPITPQNEIPEYLSREMPKHGKKFFQCESELSGINMILGASAAGARAFTSSSGPGLSLMLEAISSMALTRLPCVIIDIMRSGPGMGDLAPAQEDYKLAGNGSYKIPILLPKNVQQAVEMTYEAFDIADQYGTPVLVLADGMIGQMMEPVDFSKLPPRRTNLPEKPWRLAGTAEKGYRTEMLLSYGRPLTEVTWEFEHDTMPAIMENEARYESCGVEDADIVIVAYGTAARMAEQAIAENRTGQKVGLITPLTAWPFPNAAFDAINPNCKAILCAEINTIGQMIDDVKIASCGRWPVHHVGNSKYAPMNQKDILEAIEWFAEEIG